MSIKDVTDSIKESRKVKSNQASPNPIWKKLGQATKWLYIIYAIFLAVYYYVVLPPIHYAASEFWVFFAMILVGFGLIYLVNRGVRDFRWKQLKQKSRAIKWSFSLITGLILVAAIAQLIMTPLFFAKQYANLLVPTEADFKVDFKQSEIDQIPLIDRETAKRLGNRKIGALANLVSQFEASADYTQINIEDYPYRVSPLVYAGFFKWLNNFQAGIPHYLKVDMVTGDVTVETPPQPIKYSKADMFNRDVTRKLRFAYPFTLFGNPSFEIDDQGNPYYIASTYKRNFLFLEPEVNGLVTLNAMTGETQRYSLKDIPTWVDRVYSADLIMHQLNLNGSYKNGFWNSIFTKSGVTKTTEGYNYLPMNDDIYLYTGITSVNSDESNIGFVLVNMRTKETHFYPVTSADEYSAMVSAEGSVQEKGYKATFPLLINLNGQPMYILSLKDSSGLIKSYALIDVQNYQNVYIDSSIKSLVNKFMTESGASVESIETEEDLSRLQGHIEEIQATVVEGNTVYYFMLDGKVYRANIQLSEALPFLKAGDYVDMEVNAQGLVREIKVAE